MESQPVSTPVTAQDEEIDLLDLWDTLLRRKKIIIAFFLATVLAVGAAMLAMKPVYESRAVLAVGQVGQFGQAGQMNVQQAYLEDPQVLVQRLKEQYQVGDKTAGPRPLPRLESVTLDKKTANNIIVLTASGYSAAEAQGFLQNVTAQVLQQHQEIYNDVVSGQQTRVAALRQQLKVVDQSLSDIDRSVQNSAGRDNTLAAVMVMEKSSLQNQRQELVRQLSEAITVASPVYTKPTQVLRDATLPVAPARPKPWYLAVAAVLGLVLGVFAALIAEAMAQRRRNTAA